MDLDILLKEIKTVDYKVVMDINELLDTYIELNKDDKEHFIDGLSKENKNNFTKLMEGGLI